jgi:hypothetical protein
MPPVEMESVATPTLADRVALVRAQLEPIRSRVALLESYRRESLCRLATPVLAAGSPQRFSRSLTPCAGWSSSPTGRPRTRTTSWR